MSCLHCDKFVFTSRISLKSWMSLVIFHLAYERLMSTCRALAKLVVN